MPLPAPSAVDKFPISDEERKQFVANGGLSDYPFYVGKGQMRDVIKDHLGVKHPLNPSNRGQWANQWTFMPISVKTRVSSKWGYSNTPSISAPKTSSPMASASAVEKMPITADERKAFIANGGLAGYPDYIGKSEIREVVRDHLGLGGSMSRGWGRYWNNLPPSVKIKANALAGGKAGKRRTKSVGSKHAAPATRAGQGKPKRSRMTQNNPFQSSSNPFQKDRRKAVAGILAGVRATAKDRSRFPPDAGVIARRRARK